MYFMVAKPAVQARGLPPYVPPIPPLSTESMISFLPTTALSGVPDAIDFASVIKSGFMS